MTELIIDLFAGGGGASEGIRLALGRDPDAAINHNRLAVAMHKANHPETRRTRRRFTVRHTVHGAGRDGAGHRRYHPRPPDAGRGRDMTRPRRPHKSRAA